MLRGSLQRLKPLFLAHFFATAEVVSCYKTHAMECRFFDFMPYNNPVPESKTRGKAAGGLQSLVQAEKLMQIAFVLPSAMIIGWLAGAWAGAKLHQPWMTVAGVIFGCVAGLYYVIRLAMDAEKSAGASDASIKKENGFGDKENDSGLPK